MSRKFLHLSPNNHNILSNIEQKAEKKSLPVKNQCKPGGPEPAFTKLVLYE